MRHSDFKYSIKLIFSSSFFRPFCVKCIDDRLRKYCQNYLKSSYWLNILNQNVWILFKDKIQISSDTFCGEWITVQFINLMFEPGDVNVLIKPKCQKLYKYMYALVLRNSCLFKEFFYIPALCKAYQQYGSLTRARFKKKTFVLYQNVFIFCLDKNFRVLLQIVIFKFH